MSNQMMELRQRHAGVLEEAEALVNLSEGENRDLNEAEQQQYDGFLAEAQQLAGRIERLESLRSVQGPSR